MQQSYLVIVESPAKAKTINKYLGKEFLVTSSIGHIRDLPNSNNREKLTITPPKAVKLMSDIEKKDWQTKKAFLQQIHNMGINPENWQADYQILPGKEKVVKELKKLAKQAKKIYLATDMDREGEAIAWHLKEMLGTDAEYHRVIFNQITKVAIQKSFNNPAQLNNHKVEAQQTRRFLDRIVGFMLSPLLWKKITRGLSAGRVQSVAVRLIVEREREIRIFKPEEYWEIKSLVSNKLEQKIPCQVVKYNQKTFVSKNETETNKFVKLLEKTKYIVAKQEKKKSNSYPSPPFITSTLQQTASTNLGFSVKRTMTVAQRLYEAGFITYMRTDSIAISNDALSQTRDYIKQNFANKYLPDKPNIYKNKSNAQEAHEAIRTTNVNVLAKEISISEDAQKLYQLIWQQLIASQMTPAIFNSTTVTINAAQFELRAKGRILIFDGYTKVLKHRTNNNDVLLPEIEVGEVLDLNELSQSQHFTKAPPRYTEAALIKELEKKQIGRPSTYASIISTIQERNYVKLDKKRFFANKMGEIVTDRLIENFNNLINYNFTAEMEKLLDDISNNKKSWKNILDKFYNSFKQQLEKAYDEQTGMRVNQPIKTDIHCPDCKQAMLIRNGINGIFLGCSGYNNKDTESVCKKTLNLEQELDQVYSDCEDLVAKALNQQKRCNKCEMIVNSFIIDSHRKLYLCSNSPKCDYYLLEKGNFKTLETEIPTIECDKCQQDMVLKTGRFGKYFDCSNTECKNTRKVLKNSQVAPPKMTPIPMVELKCKKVNDHYILRDGITGLFLAASKFPKLRETRSPLISELLTVKDQLDSKYHYLLTAPSLDPDNNPSITRYSRKMQDTYIGSIKNNKTTSWKLFYKDGKWQETNTKKSK